MLLNSPRRSAAPATTRILASCLLSLSLLLSGCASFLDVSLDDWPDDIPSAEFFIAAYEADSTLQDYQTLDEYLYWVKAFYEGSPLYPRGWNDLVMELFDVPDDPGDLEARARNLYALGRDIAAEWSKANEVRLVDNSNVAVWGQAAQRSIAEDNIDETIDNIAADFERLMARELLSRDITADRYHEQDPDDFFAL